MKYTILEFKDGLQLVPSKWLMDGEGKCFYPPFISQLRVDRAIEEEEEPGTDWKMYNVQRIFGSAATYKQGIKKLNLAMRFLEIDNEVECLDENKKSRIIASHKRHRDELDDDCLSPKRVLSPLHVMRHFPQDQNIQVLYTPPPFTSPFYTPSLQPPNLRSEIDINNSYLGSSNIQREKQNEISELTKSFENFEKEISLKLDKINEKLQIVDEVDKKLQIVDKINEKLETVDKIKEVLQTLDKISEKLHDVDKIDLMNEKLQTIDEINEKLSVINQRIGKLQSKIQANNCTDIVARESDETDVARMMVQFYNDVEDNLFPISSVEELEEFDKKMQNQDYFMQVVDILKEVEGKDVYYLVTGILKKLMTDELAEQYSWLGRKGKRVFKPFLLNKAIFETVRTGHLLATEDEVNNITGRWLVAAKTRRDRIHLRNRRSLPEKLYNVNE